MGLTLTPEQQANTILFSGEIDVVAGQRIAERMGIVFGHAVLGDFPSSDTRVRLEDNVRGLTAILYQPHAPSAEGIFSVPYALQQHLEMGYAAESNKASRIIGVAPTIAGARQDRISKRGEAPTVALTLRQMQAAGFTDVVTTDIHSTQSLAAFRPHPDHLTTIGILAAAIEEEMIAEEDDYFVTSADPGRFKMATHLAGMLGLQLELLDKSHAADGSIQRKRDSIEGVEGRIGIVVDDMIDGASTMVSAGEILENSGVRGAFAVGTHAWLTGKSIEKLNASIFSKVILTDTVPTGQSKIDRFDSDTELDIVSTVDMHADALTQILIPGGSVSQEFQGRNWS